MPQLSERLTRPQGYCAVLTSFRVPYDNSAKRVKAGAFPIEEVETLNLLPFSRRGYRTTREIAILVRVTKDTTIVRASSINLFAYARSYGQALDSFKSLLIDYYVSLRRRKRTLGKNLLQDLEYLNDIIVHEKTNPRKNLQKEAAPESY